MDETTKEVMQMTDKQSDTNRNDLIELMIEKAMRIVTNEEELAALVEEYSKLKH